MRVSSSIIFILTDVPSDRSLTIILSAYIMDLIHRVCTHLLSKTSMSNHICCFALSPIDLEYVCIDVGGKKELEIKTPPEFILTI